jgi:hypothetical protein
MLSIFPLRTLIGGRHDPDLSHIHQCGRRRWLSAHEAVSVNSDGVLIKRLAAEAGLTRLQTIAAISLWLGNK